MEIFLRNLEHKFPWNNVSEEISILTFIAQLSPALTHPNEFTQLSKIIYKIMSDIYSLDLYNNYLRILTENSLRRYILINDYTIHVRDRRFFQTMFLFSLESCKEIFQNQDLYVIVKLVMNYITKSISINCTYSLSIVKLLDAFVKKYVYYLDLDTKIQLLQFVHKISISQIEGFKYYANSISKVVLLSKSDNRIARVVNIHFIPIRGIDTKYTVDVLSKQNITHNMMIIKILKLFSNNIENGDGAVLYKLLLCPFDDWKREIWPEFMKSFQNIEYEGEFFQSLLKYWIPLSVTQYKSDLYKFIQKEPISDIIKAHILLETQRKGYYEKELFSNDLAKYFSNEITSTLALNIVSATHKQSSCPSEFELNQVKCFLYSTLTNGLNQDQCKALEQFMSQLFFVAHNSLLKNMNIQDLQLYERFLEDIYSYCCINSSFNNVEMAEQIYKVVCDTSNSSQNLRLLYKFEPSYAYETNLFRKKLLEENKWKFSCENTANLWENVNFEGLLQLIESKSHSVNIQNTVEISKYCNMLFCNTIENEQVKNLFEKLEDNLFDSIENQNEFFKKVLLLEAILSYSTITDNEIPLLHMIEDCMNLIEFILDNIINKEDEPDTFLTTVKGQKVLEAFINNVLCLLELEDIWYDLNKENIFRQLCKVIEISNMKRPVTLSINVLKTFGMRLEVNERDKKFKFRFLNNRLETFYKAPSELNIKIRRHPESRMVIHSMVVSEKHPARPLLNWTLQYLLKILTKDELNDTAVSSALHSIEILISDNILTSFTIPYIASIIFTCVKLFNTTSWNIRNAALQLTKTLIDRFYGVLIGPNNRPKTVQDLLVCFPILSSFFCKVLLENPLNDSAVIVLQFLTESQCKNQPFSQAIFCSLRQALFIILIHIIKRNANQYGLLAANSYISLCYENDIPQIYRDLTDFIKQNFEVIKIKSTLKNFILLLQGLYKKYINSFEHSVNRAGIQQMNLATEKVFDVFCQSDSKQFDFLSLHIRPAGYILSRLQMINLEKNDFAVRIWQQNNLPSLIIKAKMYNLCKHLEIILLKNILECVEIKILSVLLQRFQKKEFSSEVIQNIVNILAHKVISTKKENCYVLNCYFKTILILSEAVPKLVISESVIDDLRHSYKNTSNIYKIFIFVIILSHVAQKTESDKDFVKSALNVYLSLDLSNEEIAEDVSSSLRYLYQCLPCPCKRVLVFKIACFIVYQHGFYDFVCFIGKCNVRSSLDAFVKLLKFELLMKCLDQKQILIECLVRDVYKSILAADMADKSETNTYYSCSEDRIKIPKCFVDKVVVRFFKDAGIISHI